MTAPARWPLIVLAALALLGAGTPPPSPAIQRAFLTVKVNTVDRGEVLTVIDGDDVGIAQSDLAKLGIANLTLAAIVLPFGTFLSLRSGSPALHYTLDVDALTLDVRVQPQYLAGSKIDVRSAKARSSVGSAPRSGFLNYAFTGGYGLRPGVSAQAGVRVGRALFQSAFSYGAAVGAPPHTMNLTFDSVRLGRRIVVGDSYSLSDPFDTLGAAVQLTGVSVATDSSINPDLLHASAAGIAGYAGTPTTAVIYVNGTPVQREQLAPGPYQLTNIPLGGGFNSVQVVLQDAFGHTQTIARSFYDMPQLLNKRESAYYFALGKPRNEGVYGTPYESETLLAHYGYGISPNLTVGSRLERNARMTSLGGSASFATRLGAFSAQLAGSTSDDGNGFAYALKYSLMMRRLSLAASLLGRSPRYADAGLRAQDNRPVLEQAFSAGVPVGSSQSLSVEYVNAVPRDAQSAVQNAAGFGYPVFAERRFEVRSDVRLRNGIGLSVSAGRGRTFGVSGPIFSLNLTIPQGRDGMLSLVRDVGNGSDQSTLTLQHPLERGTGIGYRADIGTISGTREEDVQFDYRGAMENLSLQLHDAGNSAGAMLDFAGGIGFVGDHAFFSAPIFDSFAILDVGIPNVRVYANNTLLGRTDKHGRFVAPELFSYQTNELSVAAADTPADALIEHPLQFLTPAYRSGSYVSFGGHEVQAFVGALQVRLEDGRVHVPAYGLLTVRLPGTDATSDVGVDGEFYLENVPPGTYPAIVRYKGGSCSFMLAFPHAAGTIVKLGSLVCALPPHV